MLSWIKKTAFWVLGVAAVCIALGWLVLVAPFFADFRRTFVQDLLSQQIGQPLIIETDVRVFVAPTTHVTVSDVAIPSETIDGLNLAELNLLEFDLDLISVIRGRGPGIDNIKINGLAVNMITRSDGVRSWSQSAQPSPASDEPAPLTVDEQYGIIAFLSNKTVDVSSVTWRTEHNTTGFEFLYALETAQLEQLEGGAAVALFSRGTVNDQPIEIEGYYPEGAPFTTSVSLGDIQLTFDGNRLPEDAGGGIAGDLTLDTGEIGDILEVLKLKRSLEGSARLTARLVRQGTGLAVEDFRTVADFPNGPAVTVEGSAEDLFRALDFDVRINAQFFPEGRLPRRATELSELELVSVDTYVVSEGEKIEVKEILLKTNLFEAGLNEIGPISIGRVLRTENGTLAMEDIEVQTGPKGSPYLIATGHIEDLLELKDLDFTGRLNAPANLVMPEFRNDIVQAFGGIVAEFGISDESGQLSLKKLEARSENTDLWTMRANASARSFTSVDDVDFELDLDVPDGGAFLEALDLEKVDIGPVGFFASAVGKDKAVETRFSLNAGESNIDTDLNTAVDKDGRPTVRGRIHSKLLNMNDLDKTGEAVVQLMSLDNKNADAASAQDGSANGKPGREVQPLVLEGGEDTTEPELPKKAEDGRTVQPLVLEQPAADLAKKNAVSENGGRTVQPLVLKDQPADGSPLDLLNPAKVGRDLDLEIGIEVEKIVGQAGVSKISSKLMSKNGKADLGPLEFNYGGGYFRIGAAVDFIEAPQLAHVFGATSGWDFGEILEEVGAGIKAYGKLRADFDLTGNHSSARSFVDSMYGSVTVSMVNGKIASSLLELAGLGLFPWLFSKERQQGYTDIVCFVAPLRINSGKVTSNAIVVETKSVQLVAAGSVDWRKDQIAIRAEPRPVGRPLARTAWPFEVKGRLSNPDFKIGGRSRQKSESTAPKPAQTPGTRKPCKPDILQTQ